MFVFILRVKGAEVNEQNSDSESADYEDDMSLPFTKKAKSNQKEKVVVDLSGTTMMWMTWLILLLTVTIIKEN